MPVFCEGLAPNRLVGTQIGLRDQSRPRPLAQVLQQQLRRPALIEASVAVLRNALQRSRQFRLTEPLAGAHAGEVVLEVGLVAKAAGVLLPYAIQMRAHNEA